MSFLHINTFLEMVANKVSKMRQKGYTQKCPNCKNRRPFYLINYEGVTYFSCAGCGHSFYKNDYGSN